MYNRVSKVSEGQSSLSNSSVGVGKGVTSRWVDKKAIHGCMVAKPWRMGRYFIGRERVQDASIPYVEGSVW